MIITPEQRAELIKVAMAGIYEIGGTISFDVSPRTLKNGTTKEYSYPKTSLGDSDVVKINLLREWFGGSVSTRWNYANQWNKKGTDVPDLLFPMAPYAPSREMHLLGFELWQMEDDPEERVRLAREVQMINQTEDKFPSVQTYQYLIANPEFLAGNYFARGSVREPHKPSRTGLPRVIFNTLNKPLLKAIQSEYGGYLVSYTRGGNTLDIENGETARFIETIAPHLIYPDPALTPYLS